MVKHLTKTENSLSLVLDPPLLEAALDLCRRWLRCRRQRSNCPHQAGEAGRFLSDAR